MRKLLQYSTYLFSKSSFLTGLGQIFDFTGSYPKQQHRKLTTQTDTHATVLDWLAVGDDLRVGVKQFEKQYGYARQK